jgi:glycosidase
MQWNAQQHAGFSSTQPWLPVNSSYVETNVEKQKGDKDSLYNIYKALLGLRKEHKPLQAGEWEPLLCGKRGIIAYERVYENENIMVILNFTASSRKTRLHITSEWQVLFSTHRQSKESVHLENLKLFPFEATVLLNKKRSCN